MTTPSPPSQTEYALASLTERDRLYLQFDLFRDQFHEAFARALALAGVGVDGAWRALDVACGEGLYSASIADRYPHATIAGLDRDEEAIATARSAFGNHDRLSFHPTDVHAQLGPIVGEGFDIAFVEFGMGHFRDGALALRRIYDVLRPGGMVMLLDPAGRFFDFPNPSAMRLQEASTALWKRYGTFASGDRQSPLLAGAGFVDITTEHKTFVLGGPTPNGQAQFAMFIELFRSGRTTLVERACVMSASEFDQHLENMCAANDGHRQGSFYLCRAMARKPE